MTYLLLATALTLSAIAAYYAIAGLIAIFASMPFAIMIMGGALEASKLVVASWLYRNFKSIPVLMRTYFTTALVVLMLLTSMGIFGFLSKAHIEQTSLSGEQSAQLQVLSDKLNRSEAKISRWTTDLNRLNTGDGVRVDILITNEQSGLDIIYTRINKEKDGLRSDVKVKIDQQQLRIKQAQHRRASTMAAAEKKFSESFGGSTEYENAVVSAKAEENDVLVNAQNEILAINAQLDKNLDSIEQKYKAELDDINNRIQGLRSQANNKTQDIDSKIAVIEQYIDSEQTKVDSIREDKFIIEKQTRKLEAEVGPIKYIAELVYTDTDNSMLEQAVRIVILMIVFVFDPLAVLLLMAASREISQRTASDELDEYINIAKENVPADDEGDAIIKIDEEDPYIEDAPQEVDEPQPEVRKWHPEIYKEPATRLRGSISASALIGESKKAQEFVEKATEIVSSPSVKSTESEY